MNLPVGAAESLPPAPDLYFNDYAGVVPKETAARLNTALEGFERETSSQIVVAVFRRLPEGTVLEDFSSRTFAAWGIGRRQTNNGAALFVFTEDRRLRIEVGYGLEGAIPDAVARRIIQDKIVPRLRDGDWGGGLSAGVEGLMAAARGEYVGTGRTVADRGRRNFSVGPVILLAVMFILVMAMASRRQNRSMVYDRRGRHRWGGWPGGGWGGGQWGGGGFGGFGGGGGGGGFSGGGGLSGGGGASGRW